jgi:hypothetical protein
MGKQIQSNFLNSSNISNFVQQTMKYSAASHHGRSFCTWYQTLLSLRTPQHRTNAVPPRLPGLLKVISIIDKIKQSSNMRKFILQGSIGCGRGGGGGGSGGVLVVMRADKERSSRQHMEFQPERMEYTLLRVREPDKISR